jgi:hypothetical protein
MHNNTNITHTHTHTQNIFMKDTKNILSKFIKIKDHIISYKLDKRGAAIARFRSSLPSDYPTATTVQTFHETLLSTIETFPPPSGRNLMKIRRPKQTMNVAIVRGDGTGWVIGATSQVAYVHKHKSIHLH